MAVLRQKRLERQELKDQLQSRKSTKANLKAAIAAREKFQAREFAEGRDGSDAAAVAETTGDFGSKERSRREDARGRNAADEAFGRGRLRRDGFSCLIFCILLRATVTSAVGAWTCGLALRGRSNQVLGVVQQRRDRGQGVSVSIFGGSEPGVSSYVASSGSCLVDTHCGDIYRFRLPCGQGSYPLSACGAVCCGDKFVNAVAQPLPDADFKAGVRRWGQAQRSRTPSFARWQIFHDEFLLMSCAVAGS